MKLNDLIESTQLTHELKKYTRLLDGDRYLVISKGSAAPKIVELPYGLHGRKRVIKQIRLDQMLELMDSGYIEFYRAVGSRRIYRQVGAK